MKALTFGILFLLTASAASAVDYFELEVYPFETAPRGESSFENATSASVDAVNPESGESAQVLRSTFEYSYGLTNSVELAAYADYTRTSQENLNLNDARIRARARLFEKDRLPVDLGFYTEGRFIQDGTIEGELKGIFEKQLGRFALALNPTIERILKGKVEQDLEFSYGASLSYRLSRMISPHLDFFDDFNSDKKSLISPAVDLKVAEQFSVGARVAWGLTDAAEKHIFGTRVEYEF